jgi:hypothetical protein
MGAVNQGTFRIVIVVALIAVGAVVLANGFDDEPSVSATPTGSPTPTGTPTQEPTGTGSPTPTDTPTDEGPEPNTSGVLFQTLNGTEVTGLAGVAQKLLEEAGYVAAAPADNSPLGGVETTTVYYRGGDDQDQNRSDAQYVADEFFDGADVGRLGTLYDDVVDDTAAIVVVVGQDFADAIAA